MPASPTSERLSSSSSNGWLSAALALLVAPLIWLSGAHGAPVAPEPNGTTPPPLSTPDVTAVAAGSDSESPCVDRFLAPLDPAGGQASAGKSNGTTWSERVSAATVRILLSLGAVGKLDALVATVPDPIDSGMGYGFDSALQAIRLGMETPLRQDDPNLFRDRSFLPWLAADGTADERANGEACRERTPGIITFRSGNPAKPRLMVVLLVGETPTTGVHHDALVNALEAARILTEPQTGQRHDPLRLLGPTFSGSAYSIRRALKDWRDMSLKSGVDEVRIITGSATGGALRQTLSSLPGQDDSWFSQGTVRFNATTIPEAQLQCRYLWFLRTAMGEAKSGDGVDPRDPLDNVALLHESGTEFGSTLAAKRPLPSTTAATDPAPCELRAGIDLSFPAHISALRDAYEDMDRKESAPHPEVIARSTALEVSLRESRAPRGMDAEPSAKTTYASDVSVSRILGSIARTTIRHVVIQSTDVADAIFLARKIRDVAPDVRLAFLKADVLLLHPAFQHDLFGSLVITPYPFLGSSDFTPPDPLWTDASTASRRRDGFENDSTEGVFNAVLALRGAEPGELHEYTPLSGDARRPEDKPILPVWIAAIGQDGFIPLLAGPSRGKADSLESDVIFRGVEDGPRRVAKVASLSPAKAANTPAWRQNWGPFDHVQLLIADNVVLPRLWRFLLLALGIGFVVDRFLQQRAASSLSDCSVPGAVRADTDGDADRSIVRTKWKLYAAIRTFVLAAAFTYMAAFWMLASGVHRDPYQYLSCGLLCAAIALAAFACGQTTVDFAGDYFAFAKSAGCQTPSLFVRRIWHGRSSERPAHSTASPKGWVRGEAAVPERWDRWTLWLGVARADVDIPPDALSFAQLRLLANLALVIAVAFVVFQTLALYWGMELPTGDSAQLLRVLLVSRTLHLLGGMSPAAPTLLCLGVVYVWSTGRMARLRVVHSLSQLSPPDEVLDLVSTPIRLTLYPDFPGDPTAKPKQSDDSFTHVERRAINSIVRPITGPEYCGALAITLVVPFGIFWLNPLSTLEISWGTRLLYLGLFLCSALIGNTIIQLFQYWNALHLLLKSVFQHRLGRSFSLVAPFVREPLHDQVSRTPHDVLRLAACATQFDDLVRTARRLERFRLVGSTSEAELEEVRDDLRRARREAIATSNLRDIAGATRAEERLGRQLIEATRRVTRLLHRAWDGTLAGDSGRPDGSGGVASKRLSSGPTTKRAAELTDPSIPDLPLPPSDLLGSVPSPGPQFRDAVASASAGPRHQSSARRIAQSALPSPQIGSIVPKGTAHSALAPAEAPSEAFAPEAWRYEKNERRWVTNAESFAATVVALLINRHVRQLDYFVYTLLASALLLMGAALSYPFEPHRLLLTWIWGLVLTAAISGLWIYIELDRNSLLSRIARTNPGELTLNRELALRVVAWGIVPLTAAAATQYPALANTLARLITPFGAAH